MLKWYAEVVCPVRNILLVVQALVEHFSGAGQPEAVERAVLHMDIASLDLNQVTASSHVYQSYCAAQTCLRNRHTHTSCFARNGVLYRSHLGSARTCRVQLFAHSQICWQQSLLLGGSGSQTWEVCCVLIMTATCSQALYCA